ncbi:hypothetical protein GCM10028772_03000 [Nocardioides ultimimeridianus]
MSYVVTVQAGGGSPVTLTTANLSAVVSGLANGTQYAISVRATTPAGQGPDASTTATPAAAGTAAPTVTQASAEYSVAAGSISNDPTQAVSELLAGSSSSTNIADQLTDVSTTEATIDGLGQLLGPSDNTTPSTATVSPTLVVPLANGSTQVEVAVTTVSVATDNNGVATDVTASQDKALTFTGGTPQLTAVSDLNSNLEAVANGEPPSTTTDTSGAPQVSWQPDLTYARALKTTVPVTDTSGTGKEWRDAVVRWAHNHVYGYHQFGSMSSCASFASRILNTAAQFPMIGTPTRIGTSVMSTPVTDWWYVEFNAVRGARRSWSRTWSLAEDLKQHMRHGIAGKWLYDATGDGTGDLGGSRIGDLIFWTWPTWSYADHATTITAIGSGGVRKITYQSTDELDLSVPKGQARTKFSYGGYAKLSVFHPSKYND